MYIYVRWWIVRKLDTTHSMLIDGRTRRTNAVRRSCVATHAGMVLGTTKTGRSSNLPRCSIATRGYIVGLSTAVICKIERRINCTVLFEPEVEDAVSMVQLCKRVFMSPPTCIILRKRPTHISQSSGNLVSTLSGALSGGPMLGTPVFSFCGSEFVQTHFYMYLESVVDAWFESPTWGGENGDQTRNAFRKARFNVNASAFKPGITNPMLSVGTCTFFSECQTQQLCKCCVVQHVSRLFYCTAFPCAQHARDMSSQIIT